MLLEEISLFLVMSLYPVKLCRKEEPSVSAYLFMHLFGVKVHHYFEESRAVSLSCSLALSTKTCRSPPADRNAWGRSPQRRGHQQPCPCAQVVSLNCRFELPGSGGASMHWQGPCLLLHDSRSLFPFSVSLSKMGFSKMPSRPLSITDYFCDKVQIPSAITRGLPCSGCQVTGSASAGAELTACSPSVLSRSGSHTSLGSILWFSHPQLFSSPIPAWWRRKYGCSWGRH